MSHRAIALAARLHAVLRIGEQAGVFGDPVNEAVRDEGVAAAERESAAACRAERDDGYLAVEVADWHQAAAAADALAGSDARPPMPA